MIADSGVEANCAVVVARFVARELAPIDSVTSTATHFVMRRYKELDVELFDPEEDNRGQFLYD